MHKILDGMDRPYSLWNPSGMPAIITKTNFITKLGRGNATPTQDYCLQLSLLKLGAYGQYFKLTDLIINSHWFASKMTSVFFPYPHNISLVLRGRH